MSISEYFSQQQLEADGIVFNHKKFPKNSYLISKGDAASHVYLVLSGKFKIFVSDLNGREATLNILHEGDTIGELAAISNDTASANVVALTDAEVISVKKSDFVQFLHKNPNITWHLLEYLADRTKRLSDKVAGLVLSDVFGRVTSLLQSKAVDNVVSGLSHQDIASEVGSTREMTSKIIGMLKKANYIDTGRKKITILKPLPESHEEYEL